MSKVYYADAFGTSQKTKNFLYVAEFFGRVSRFSNVYGIRLETREVVMGLSGKVCWKEAVHFEAEIRNHKVLLDSPHGVTNKGPSPKELALIGIAGCSGMDVASILTKKRLSLSKCDVSISTDLTEGHPSIFKDIKIVFEVEGGSDVTVENVIKAVELSMTKYCGVSAMFVPVCDISYTVKLNGKEIGKGKPNFEIKG